jgi:hypothetical protein
MAREDARPTKAGSLLAGGARLLTSHREAVWCVYYPNMLRLMATFRMTETSANLQALRPPGNQNSLVHEPSPPLKPTANREAFRVRPAYPAPYMH